VPRTWRKEPRENGTWRLISGRAEARVRVSLGVMTEGDATRALETMQALEHSGDAHRVMARLQADPEFARAFLLAGDPGVFELLPKPEEDYGALTVAEYFERYYWPARKDQTSPIGVAESTAAEELLYWRQTGRGGTGKGKHTRPKRGILDGEIGATRMRDLNDQLWERWQAAQTHLSPRSKAIRRNAYSALLSYARRMGHTAFKPEFFRLRGATKRTRELSDPLTLQEVAALLKVADPTRRAMWAIGVGQGLRPGELVRMEWPDVDWTSRTMLVRGTKTEESWDRIPMTPLAYRELAEFHLRQGRPETGPCFTYGGKGSRKSEKGTTKSAYKAPRRFESYRKALAADAREAGITRPVTPYLLRHSFATIAFLTGVKKEVARRVGRWTDDEMLDKVYSRPRPVDLVEMLARFDLAQSPNQGT
jgi:integrase